MASASEVLASDPAIKLPKGMTVVASPGVRAVVVTRDGCSFCRKAKSWLEAHGVKFATVALGQPDHSKAERLAFLDSIGQRTFPQVFIDGVRVGGYDELIASDFAKGLDLAGGLEDEDF